MGPARAEADALRDLLAKRVDELAAEAVRADGQIAPDRLDTIARLARLVELRSATATVQRPRHVVPVVALITLLVASVVLFVRVPSTQVEMDLSASEIGLVVPKFQVFSEAMSVTSLGLSGVIAVELPGAGRRQAADVLLTVSERHVSPGTLDIDPITLPAGSRVLMRQLDGPRHYEVIIGSGVSGVTGAANGAVQIVVPPDLNVASRFTSPQHIGFETDTAEVRLDLTLRGVGPAPLRVPLSAGGLRLYRIDQLEGPEQTVVREVSTVRAGTIYFESINGQERRLRPGEDLRFGGASGEVREWRLDEGGIGMRFRGTVSGMSTGSGAGERSLMPTMLEWLRARHGVELLWGTTAYVVGILITVLGWWKRQS